MQYTKMLSQKSIAQTLPSAPPVEKDHQRFLNPCPHEHSEDLKGQQDIPRLTKLQSLKSQQTNLKLNSCLDKEPVQL